MYSGKIKDYWSFDVLQNQEEHDITSRVKNGDEEAKHKLIKAYLKLVVSIARRFTYNSNFYLEDLIQEGCLGLISAAENFNPEENMRFASYAKMWIKEIIKRRFCKDVYMVYTPFRVVKKSFYFSKEKKFSEELKKGENNAIIDILKKPLYISDKRYEEEEFELEAENKYYSPEYSYEIKEISFMLKGCLKELDNKERAIIENRFFNSNRPTYAEIANELSLSPETVRNIERRALNKLRCKLSKMGFSI